MKLKTQFVISMVTFGLILLAISMSVIFTNQRVELLDSQEDIAINIERGVNDLSYLSNDYILFSEDQKHTRLESKFASISQALSSLKSNNLEQALAVNNIKEHQQRFRTVFSNVASKIESSQKSYNTAGYQSLVEISWSRMAVQNRGMAFDAFRLTQAIRDEKDRLKQMNSMLIFTLLSVFGIYFIINFLLVYRRTLNSISDLRSGTDIIGSGNLDFAVPVKRNDEIGGLTKAFNRMTSNLKNVTASKSELEKEIAERKLVEIALYEEQERLAVTLGSIGDGVIATDTKGRITLLNRASEELTGWTQKEAFGQPLLKIFNIINEKTGKRAEDPVSKTLKTGLIVGLANHTALIAKDGTQRSIADSCAPIKAKDSSVLGAVLVFRDVTEQQRAEHELAQIYETEHRIAQTLQKSLLAEQIPEIDDLEIKYFYQSATKGAEVGGDFYNFFRISDNNYGLVVGDVAGKGILAAAETTKIKHLLRDRAYLGMKPSELMASVNEAVLRQAGDINAFTALTFGLYDSQTSILNLSNAGNPYPYLASKDKFLEVTSVPVGIMAEENYHSIDVKLEKEEIILFYTDGLTESRYKGELFGEERVRSFVKENKNLGLVELIQGLAEEARQFSKNNISDDILILALKKT